MSDKTADAGRTMADVLAAHVGQAWGPSSIRCCGFWRPHALHAAHQADALAQAGYGDVRALLHDLGKLARSERPASDPSAAWVHKATLRALAARHTPPAKEDHA